jgi:hypothetical protein
VREENANDINKLLQFFTDCHSQNTQFQWAPKLDSNGEIHNLFYRAMRACKANMQISETW